VGLLERVGAIDDIRTIEGDIPIQHVYTAGVAGERVLRELKDNGRLFGTRCATCQVTYAPARRYCERCLSPLDEWVEVPLAGTLASFTIVRVDLDGNPLPRPGILGLIDLDTATGSLVHWVSGVAPDRLRIGQRVAAELRQPAERRGSITDIAHFRVIDST
jgi:uncharacterized OB-fold protein